MTDNYQIKGDAAKQTGRVVFVASPAVEEWGELQIDLLNVLEKGYQDWTFDLEAVEMFSSIVLGRLLRLHIAVKKYSGNLVLKVRRDSSLGRTLVEMNLVKVLTISFT